MAVAARGIGVRYDSGAAVPPCTTPIVFSFCATVNAVDDRSPSIPWTAPGAWPLLLSLGCLRALSALPERSWPVVSRIIGGLLWRVARSRRRVVEVNLGIALPDAAPAERAEIARECFTRFVVSLLEAGRLWFGSEQFLDSRVRIDGVERLRELSRDHAILLTAPHYLSVDLVGNAIASQVPLTAVYARAKNPHFERFESRKRLRYTRKLIERQRTVSMVRALRAKETVLWLPDQSVGVSRGSVESRFFGRAVLSSRASAWFLMREDVKLVLISVRRGADHRLEVSLGEPIEGLAGDERSLTAKIDGLLEREILRQPSEYFWMHRRFKPIVPGGDNPYGE